MQEIKKRRIVLASILKPADDIRMFGKLARSLATSCDVHVIGQATGRSADRTDVTVHALPKHGRLRVQRLMAPWRVLWITWKLRPDIFVLCTAELLPVALMLRRFRGAQLVYDVQENYALNIRSGNAWPGWLRPVLAAGIRALETTAAPAIARFLLAEQSYADELPFVRGRYTVVENKVLRTARTLERARRRYLPTAEAEGKVAIEAGGINEAPGPVTAGVENTNVGSFALPHQELRLLFSGTLAASTGALYAIELARKLHAVEPRITLTVIGYAALKEARESIRHQAQGCSWVRLVGIDHPVPHTAIEQEIIDADFGLITYPANPATWGCYPTKLYEYLGYQLPILLIDNPRWTQYCAPYHAAIALSSDLSHVNATEVLRRMKEERFYLRRPEDVYFDFELGI